MRKFLEPAYVLHTKCFRDTSLLVDMFTLNHGRLRVIAKGARNIKSSLHGLMCYYSPFYASWAGKTDLPTLSKIELIGASKQLNGKSLLYGFYINELLSSLLEEHVPYERIYKAYEHLILLLVSDTFLEISIRMFEKLLLTELGYGLTLEKDINGNPIMENFFYKFEVGTGFICLEKNSNFNSQVSCFLGKNILALHSGSLVTENDCIAAKHILKLALAPHLRRNLKSLEML
jgi:DNA repair protein RecO (recombination protein O)